MKQGCDKASDARSDDQSDDERPVGIRCPDCGCRHCPVYYTRHRGDARGGKTIRRRTCRACGRRFLTFERVT